MSNLKSPIEAPQPQDLYRLLFETAADAILLIKQGRIVDCNTMAARLFGCPQADLLNKTMLDFSAVEQPDNRDSARVWQEAIDLVFAGKNQPVEWLIRRPDGEKFWTEIAMSLLTFEGKTFIQLLVHDINERKQLEEILINGRNLLRFVIDNLPDHIYVKDTKGRFVVCNVATALALGVDSPAQVIGKTELDFLPPALAEKFQADEQAIFQAGRSPVYGEDIVLDQRTGERSWVATTKVLWQDEHDAIGGLVGISRDISKSKEIEQALRESEQRLKALTEAAFEGVLITEQGKVVDANEQFAAAYGYDPLEIIGMDAWQFVASESAEFVKQRILSGTEEPYEALQRRKDGSLFFAQISAKSIAYKERSVQVTAIRDITKRKQMEQQIQESLARRGRQVQFSTSVARDIVSVIDLNELYQRVVSQVSEQFGFYYSQLLFCDPHSEILTVAAGSGDIGRQMTAEEFQVPLGVGLAGKAAAFGISAFRSNLGDDPEWHPYAHLPDARGEIAVPVRSGQQDAQAQAAALKAFIRNGFDGFIVCVLEPDVVAPIAKEALEKGLHILTQSHDLGDAFQSSYVGAEEYETGYKLGLQAGAWAVAHLGPDETLQIGVLNHRTLPPVAQREAGIVAGIRATYGHDFEIVATEMAPNSVLSAPLTTKWLKAFPGLNMIVAINDGGALGAYRVLKEMGKNDPDHFFVGGIDGVDEALEAIAEGGVFQATVSKTGRAEGLAAIRALVAAIVGQPYEKKTTISTQPVNRSNLDEFLAKQRELELADAPALSGQDLSSMRIGLSVIDLDNPFFATFAAVVAEEAERLGFELVVNDPKTVLGVLNVHSDRAGVLDAEDQLVLEGLAGQIAVAIENMRLLEEANIFRQFTEAAGQGMGFASLEGKVVYFNPAFGRILGDKLEDAIGKSIFSYYPGESLERLRSQVLPTVMEEGQWSGEFQLISRQGQIISAIQNYTLLRDQNGNPQYIANVVTDITDHKRTEDELEARLQELSSLQRLMSQEGWRAFQATRAESAYGYLFDQTTIRPVFPEDFGKGRKLPKVPTQSVAEGGLPLTRSVVVRGEVIGQIGVYDTPDRPLTTEDQAFLDSVAEQVAGALERARLLEQTQKRAVELEAVAQVSTVASTTLDPDLLLQTVVNLSKISFGLYHAHIYLFDEAKNLLVLRAGSGEVGQQMVSQGWSIEVEQKNSLVARAARTRQGVIANNVRTEASFMANPLLPDTRSELAVPMVVGERLLGVLDVQADINNRFTDDDVRIQSTLAIQVAVALQNVDLYKQTQRALAEAEAAQRRYTVQSWESYRDKDQSRSYARLRDGLTTLNSDKISLAVQEAVTRKQTVTSASSAVVADTRQQESPSAEPADEAPLSHLVIPLKVRGEVIGVLGLQETDESRTWTNQEIVLVEAIAEQMSQAAESIRLLDDSQQRAAREQRVNTIGQKIRAAQSLEEALQIAVKEVGLSLEAPQTSVKLEVK